MPLKKVDARVTSLIETAIAQRERSIMVIVGKRGRDLLPNLHFIHQKKATKTLSSSVLWCFKKDLGFSSNRKKRVKEVQKLIQRGVIEADTRDPFEMFISKTKINYLYYKDSARVMGQTFYMCVLQDFEAITPNVLARTIETVEGGGMIVILLHTISSLRQLYTMTMDVHSRFRTETRDMIIPRFNERLILSLTTLGNCLFVDDSLNVLNISSASRERPATRAIEDPNMQKLAQLRAELAEVRPINTLLAKAVTFDQAETLINLVDVIQEKKHVVVSLTAGRGRGKSAALGLAVSAAVATGYGNIMVTAPHPENLGTFFNFLLVGLRGLGYEEHTDFSVRESVAPEHGKAVVEVLVSKTHRQVIKYVHPRSQLGETELLVVDEAAAIPLVMVKALLKGRHISLLSSTINGYEGTGRSLTHKLITELREKNASFGASAGTTDTFSESSKLIECTLSQPIRYANNDEAEKWLFDLLCLHSTPSKLPSGWKIPHPSQCSLYLVNRDSLFSFNKMSEVFLSEIVSLFVASHYKNSPNDIQLLSDSPSQLLFVLVGNEVSTIPTILCSIQFSFEGEIPADTIASNMKRGYRPSGDLIPWTISQQFQDESFARLKGGRVVRISTNPKFQRMGYGTRALELLHSFFSREITILDKSQMVSLREADGTGFKEVADVSAKKSDLGMYHPRKEIPPLLRSIDEVACQPLDYLGVSFGSTQSLFSFWKRANHVPVYVRQSANELTGEHTVVMIRQITEGAYLQRYHADFRSRFMTLLSYEFRDLQSSHSLAILGPVDHKTRAMDMSTTKEQDSHLMREIRHLFTTDDIHRLKAYGRNLLDYHVILDLIPPLSRLYFRHVIPVKLSLLQQSILLSLGLRHVTVTQIQDELNLPSNQILAIFKRSIEKITKHMSSLEREEEEEKKEVAKKAADDRMSVDPQLQSTTFLEEQEEDEREGRRLEREQRIRIEREFKEYAVAGDEKEWKEALATGTDGVKDIISLRKPADTLSASAGDKKRKKKKRKAAGAAGEKKRKKTKA